MKLTRIFPGKLPTFKERETFSHAQNRSVLQEMTVRLELFSCLFSKLRINIDITVAMKCQREYSGAHIDHLLIKVCYRCKYVPVSAVIVCVFYLCLQTSEQIFWTWLRP